MAQVVKYKQGGSTSNKYGTFTIDGNTYDVNDDFLNQITNYGKSLDDDTAYQFSKITDALRSGESLTYDSNSDKLEGNVQFDVTNRQNDRMSHRRNKFGRFLGNSWRGREETARNAINALKGFSYVAPSPIGTDHDWSNRIDVEYKRDKDGKYELIDGKRIFIQGANNLQVKRRLNDLKGIVNYTTNDTFKGYGKLDKQAYIDLYNRLGDSGITDLIQRIENGTWTDEDKLALDDIGIFLGDEPTAEEIERRKTSTDSGSTSDLQEKERYQKAGLDYNTHNIFGVDDNGVITITDPNLLSLVGSGDAWLNDEFKRVYGAYSDYIPNTSGLFVINGKVYRGDDQQTLSKIQKYLDFVKENKRTAGNATNIKQYWDSTRSRSPWYSTSVDSEGNPMWSPYFQANRYAADLTGNYVRQSGDPLVYDYLPNYNPNDPSQFDVYGHPLKSLAERVYIDPVTKQRVDYNNPLQEQTDYNIINAYYDNNPTTAYNPYYNIGGTGGYKEIVNVGSSSNPNSKAALYYNPQTQLYYFNDENPGNNDYTINSRLALGEDKMRDYYWNVDSRLGKYIEQHPDILRDPEVKAVISDIIRDPYTSFISTRHADFTNRIIQKYPELAQLLRDLLKSQVLGKDQITYSGQGSNPRLRAITNANELEALGLAYRISRNKNGGIIKHQIGGVASNRGNSAKASAQAIQSSNKKLRSAGEDKIIGDRTELNASDKAEIAALIADAASLGATFVPVYGNIASAGIGAAGSLAGFGADIARDGLDWGDVGNLALNLGLDAATLIPGVGTGAKATKVAKALKNSKAIAKAVQTAFSFGATYEGLKTAWNNIQDGTWTIKDIRTVLNGVRGAANLNRIKGSAKTKSQTGDTVTLNPRNTNLPEIKLNRSELEAIQKSPKDNRSDKLEELIISKLPKDLKTDTTTDILTEYNIKRSNVTDWSWKKPLQFNRNNIVDTKQFKFDELPGTYRNPNELKWWNWNRRAAVRDAKINQQNPFFKPLHWNTNNIQDLNSITPITMPIYSNFAIDYGIFSRIPEKRSYYELSNRPTFYKKGGRIIKADNGINSEWFLDKKREPLTVQGDDVVVTANALSTKPQLYFEGIKPLTGTDLSTNPQLQSYIDNINKVTENRVKSQWVPENRTRDEKGKFFGHGNKNYTSSNISDALFGIGDFIVSTRGINRTSQKMKDATKNGMIGSQQQMPTEFYSRFSDNGLHRMYDDRIKTMRQYKAITSDPNQVIADRLMRDINADQMENERDTKFSQIFDQFNDKNTAQRQQYANIRAQITNENRNRWGQGLAQLDMIEANRIGQQAQNIKNLIYQFRQNNALDLQERRQAQLASKQLQAQNAFEAELNSKYQPLYTPEMQKLYPTFEDFMNKNYAKEYADLKNKHLANFTIDAYNEGPSHSWLGRRSLPRYEVPYRYIPPRVSNTSEIHKKGGTIQRFRKVDEQAYLDQQKAINKAVNDLNNNIIKLFLKMMS